MTTLDTAAHVTSSAARWAESLASPVEAGLRAVAGWNDARITRRMLSRLSARQLDDIGLCRDDIESIATLRR